MSERTRHLYDTADGSTTPRLRLVDGRWWLLGPDDEEIAGPFDLLRKVEDWLDANSAATL